MAVFTNCPTEQPQNLTDKCNTVLAIKGSADPSFLLPTRHSVFGDPGAKADWLIDATIATDPASWLGNSTTLPEYMFNSKSWPGSWSQIAFRKVFRRAETLIQQYGVNMVTGHSLGGYSAEIIANRFRKPGIGFAAPPPNGPFTKMAEGAPVEGFQNVNWEHDALGDVGSFGIYTHAQTPIYLSAPNGKWLTHSVDKMITYFDQKKDITNKNIKTRASATFLGWLLSYKYDPVRV